MELNTTDSSSENDRKMMGSFESFADKDEKEKKKKAKEKSLPAIFEAAEDDKKAENRGNIFEPKKAEKTEKEKPVETDKALEELTDDEAHFAAEQYVDAQKEALKQELEQVEPDSSEEAAILADAALVEAISQKLDGGEPLDDTELDAALAETIEELDIDAESDETDAEEDEDDPAASTVPAQAATHPPTATAVPPVPAPAPAAPPAPPPAGPGSGPAWTPPAGPPSGGVNTLNPTPNVAPAPVNPNVLPSPHNRGADLLVGGIIGYLIGKRRGRIKTEERLQPIQEKLEHQVTDLHTKIAERETKIRELVAARVERAPDAARPAVTERIIQRIETRTAEKAEVTGQTKEQAAEKSPERKQPSIIERLGQVLIPSPETASETRKDAATLTNVELLEIANSMIVEGVSVRRMYESGRLDAVGLRRVVGEYLNGEDFKRILSSELIAEQSPERMTFDKAQPGVASVGASDPATKTYAQAHGASNSQPDAAPRPAAENPFTGLVKDQHLKQQVKSKFITIVLVIIVLLLILVVLR